MRRYLFCLLLCCLFVTSTQAQAATHKSNKTVDAKPLVIELHWGGWLAGKTSDVANHVAALRAAGVNVVNYDYTLGSPASINQQVLAYVKQQRKTHLRIYAYGQSAGASIALWLAQQNAVDGAVGVSPVMDIPRYQKKVASLVGNQLGTLLSMQQASPKYNPCGSKPIRVYHATDDTTAPYDDSAAFNKRCSNVTLLTSTGKGHLLIVDPIPAAISWLASRNTLRKK